MRLGSSDSEPQKGVLSSVLSVHAWCTALASAPQAGGPSPSPVKSPSLASLPTMRAPHAA